jgi:peptidoglycan/xylan/chitin deacetylase (PgdA/CDA1 family)
LREVLDSLALQTCSGFEVVVVSDGDDAPTRELAEVYRAPFPIAWHFHAENRGQAAARNTGAHNATADILLFLDDDTLANETLVESHLYRHSTASDVGQIAVVGKIAEARIDAVIRPTDRFLQQSWESSLALYAARLSDTSLDSIAGEFESSLAFGLNSSISRAVFLQHGGFNEALRITDEDNELGIRFYLAGIRFIFEPAANVTHRSDKDLTEYLKSCWRQSGKSDVARVFRLRQMNSQTKRLVAPFKGRGLGRSASTALWHSNEPLHAAADWLESAANATDSKWLLRLWGRIAADANYWRSVKSTGCTLEQLQQAAGHQRIALMLHSISDPLSPAEKNYYISPKRFSHFMQRFLSSGYKTSNIQSWLDDAVSPKHVLLTFDDAYDDLYENLLPLVIEHQLTPVLFLVADRIGQSNLWDQSNGLRARNLLTLDQIREMQKYGVLFGSHTLSHPSLPSVSDNQLQRETIDSRLKLEDLLGTEVISFAYPYGDVDQRVRSAAASAGYKVAFTTLPGPNWWNDPFSQRRADINEYTSLSDFSLSLRNGETLAQSISSALRTCEENLPSSALRHLARALRTSGRRLYLGTPAEAEKRR